MKIDIMFHDLSQEMQKKYSEALDNSKILYNGDKVCILNCIVPVATVEI